MLNNWPETSIHQFLLLQEPAHHLFTDASGSWGCGAFTLPAWLQFTWPKDNPLHSIALKELFVLACAVCTPVVRVLCPLPLRQRGSSVPKQSAPRSGPDCIPTFAMLGALHGTVRLPHMSNSHRWEFKLWCRSIMKR